MARELVQSPFQPSHIIPILPTTSNSIRTHRFIPTAAKFGAKITRISDLTNFTTKVAEQNPSFVSNDTVLHIKKHLYEAVNGINRGIFGVTSVRKSEIEDLVKMLESQNPTPDPTMYLEKVNGCWKLVYSTITILGSKRTKLGLRDFISLGDFLQNIDVEKRKAVNVIQFSVRGLKLLSGQLKIEASFNIASQSRVDINYEHSTITPHQLMDLFRKNYDLLLSIFNPEGWLEITYVDDNLRIGRDDKGNIFILDRAEETET